MTVTMTHEEQLIICAKQGNPEAIAAVFNYYFEPQKIAVKVGWQGTQLVLLCESPQLQEPEKITGVFEKVLGNLGMQTSNGQAVQAILYGRTAGDSEPAWHVPLHVESLRTSTQRPIAETLAKKAPNDSSLEQRSSSDSSQSVSRESVFNPSILSQAASVQTSETLGGGTISGETVKDEHEVYGRFLCCEIGSSSPQAIAQKLLIPVESIDSVVQIMPSLILPVPYMPPSVLGIFRHQGQFLWIVDILQSLTRSRQSGPSQTHRCITVMLRSPNHDSLLGFVVPHIEPQQVHSIDMNPQLPPKFEHLPDILVPFLSDVVTSDGSPILNPIALFQDSHLQIHQRP